MNLYIQQIDGVWGFSQYRDDLASTPKAEYNAQGWYDFEPTPQPSSNLNIINSHEVYLDDNNIARYRWTTTLKTGDALAEAIRDKWAMIRMERTEMLQNTDFTQIPDAPITEEERAAWVTYRNELRNITSQSDPFNIVWPVSPDNRISQIGIRF